MIFDVRLTGDNRAELTCALEDYDHGPWFSCVYSMAYIDPKEEGRDKLVVLKSIGWNCHTHGSTIIGSLFPEYQPAAWARRLAKVLEPRIQAMLLTGQPRDLRRWIDDQLVEDIAKELEAGDEQAG